MQSDLNIFLIFYTIFILKVIMLKILVNKPTTTTTTATTKLNNGGGIFQRSMHSQSLLGCCIL